MSLINCGTILLPEQSNLSPEDKLIVYGIIQYHLVPRGTTPYYVLGMVLNGTL